MALRKTAGDPYVLTNLPANRVCWAPLLRGRPGPGDGATAVNRLVESRTFKELMLQGGEADSMTMPLAQAYRIRDHLRPEKHCDENR